MSERAVLLDTINPSATEAFEAAGFEVVQFAKSIGQDPFVELVREADVLGVRSSPKVLAEVIGSSPKLKAIGCFCVGTNHVDIESANDQGAAVFNSLHENTRSVAEHVISNVFNLLKRIPEHNTAMHGGLWTKTDEGTFEVRGKTIGIVGYGAVGSQVSVLAEAIGMEVIFFDPAPKSPPYGNARKVQELDSLLAQADIVTLHVPGGEATKNLINEQSIRLMKTGSVLINTARGEVVDYEAVLRAIESGHLGGIAADVFQAEPNSEGDEFSHVLVGQAKAILTPHTAGSTQEAQYEIGYRTAEKLVGYLATGSSSGSVNFPELGLNGIPAGTHRILHLHHNVPGVMANVNTIIANHGLNVVRSGLQTKRDLGYMHFDIEGELSPDLVRAIAEYEHTIRVQTIE